MTTSSIWSEDIESILLEMNAVALPTAHEAEEGTDPNEGKSKCGGRAQPAPPSTTDGEADGDEDSGSSFEVPIPEEFVCPLTLNVMRDPVVSKWGHSYERESIISWLVSHQSCPMTRKPLGLSGIITNHQLRSRIRKWQMEHEQDVTVLCAGSDFDSKSPAQLGGFFLMPGLDDTERSTDDEDDEPRQPGRPTAGTVGAAANASRSMGRRNNRSGVQSRRRLSNSGGTRTAPDGAAGPCTGIASGLSRRLFGRPATAA